MSFDLRDIRAGMDVYTCDGVYLGTVRRVLPAGAPGQAPPRREFDASVLPGELLGPMPTATIGNPGPVTQSARRRFATAPDGAPPIGSGQFLAGRLPLPLGWRAFSVDDVLTVSLERVVLRHTARELGVSAQRAAHEHRRP